VEDEHDTDDPPLVVKDGRCTIIDWALCSVSRDEHCVIREAYNDAVANDPSRWIFDRLARSLVDDVEDLGELSA
jgi:hypothetical protein